MKAKIKMWGHSPAVRIPSALLEAVRLREGEEVDVREENGRIVIRAIRPSTETEASTGQSQC